jgi:hypothetical protein
MKSLRSVLGVGMVDWAVLVGVAALCISAVRAEGVMITYISSTRYVQGNAIPREDAVGFSDFDVSRVGIVGPTASGLLARVEASQTSRLMADSIQVSAATRTQFLQNPQGNSISAQSFFDVVFDVDVATEFTATTGSIFSQSNGGIATVVLLRIDSGSVPVFSASSQMNSGRYRLIVQTESQSLQSFAGPARADFELAIPPTATGAAMLAGGGAFSMFRRRQ